VTSTQSPFNRVVGRQMAALTARLRQYMTYSGYELIELPIMQQADLFLTKAGDQIIERLFTFERGGKEWALRPEFTAAAAHLYSRTQQPGAIVRWQFSGPTFEEDPNLWTQEYQSLSIGAEMVGVGSALADAEIMAMAAQGLAACGIDDGGLVIGHMGLLRQVLSQFDLDSRTQHFILHQLAALFNPDEGKSFVLDQLQAILYDSAMQPAEPRMMPTTTTFIGGRTQAEIERRIQQKRQRAVERERIAAALDALLDWGKVEGDAQTVLAYLQSQAKTPIVRETLNEWTDALNLLATYEIPSNRIILKPGLVRSWEYYTGFVFELYAHEQHLGGGGRYDELVQLVGGSSAVPAVGFVYYGDKLASVVPELTAHPVELRIAPDKSQDVVAVQWAQALRKRGVVVVLAEGDAHIGADGALYINQQPYALNDIEAVLLAINGVNS
jgi:ATP phosphoribosyltransferase regulatory subunit HisZ